MAVRTRSGLILLLGWALAGCDRPIAQESTTPAAKSMGGVGVVDLDLVAKRLGRDLQMNRAVKDRLSSLNEKLASLKTSLNRLYDEKRTGFGDEPTGEQQQELQTMQQRMEVQLLESRRKAEGDLAAYRQALVDQFREQAKPVLRDVASARGLSIVVPKNNGLLLTIDPAVEITDEVAERMLAAQPQAAKPAPRPDDESQGSETSSR